MLGKLGFIGVAQSAGFKLREIKELIDGVDGADGIGEQMRSLSSQKLDEVEALLERTKAMKGWLEVAQECGCATPAECALFPAPGEEPPNAGLALPAHPGGGQGLPSPSVGLRRRSSQDQCPDRFTALPSKSWRSNGMPIVFRTVGTTSTSRSSRLESFELTPGP